MTARVTARLLAALTASFGLATEPAPVLADEPVPPCAMPVAATLADRPGTGRTTSTGGAPCVALPGEWILETGVRRQVTTGPGQSSVLASGPLTFLRMGVARRFEVGIAPPEPQSRSATRNAPVDAARGSTDLVLAMKYLVLDTARAQGSLGVSYSPPTGSGEFTAGAPTFSVSANYGLTLSPRLSFATSQIAGTAVGRDASGANRSFFVYAPSYTLAYALDANDTLLVQDAIVSRQGPLLPHGSRGFVALQHAIGNRLAVDLDYERNLLPSLGSQSNSVGIGFVWIVRARAAP